MDVYKIKYKIISGYSKEAVEDSVNKALNEGWELVGGVFVTSGNAWDTFTQTLIRYNISEK